MKTKLFSNEEIKEIANRFVISDSCQLRTIINELLNNLNELIDKNPEKTKEIDKEDYINCIDNLVTAIRSCHPTTNYEIYDTLGFNTEDFITESNHLSEENKKEANYLYNNFWKHNEVGKIFNSGRIKDHTYFNTIVIEQVEALAKQYLSIKFFKSQTLEYAIIDSLIFNEIIAFGNTLENLPNFKFKNYLGSYFWYLFKFTFNESVALIITAFIANIIDSSVSTNYWIVFATITIIRWLNPTKFKNINLKNRKYILFGEMIGVYDTRIKNVDFNSKLLQELLFDLEKKGAAFSLSVYHVLDRRLNENKLS